MARRVASNKWRDIWKRFKGGGTYPHQLAFILLNPLRGLIFSRRERRRPDGLWIREPDAG